MAFAVSASSALLFQNLRLTKVYSQPSNFLKIRRIPLPVPRRIKLSKATNLQSQPLNLEDVTVTKYEDYYELSAYEMGWIARVPRDCKLKPRFPQSIKWITENQSEDGSWGNNKEEVDKLCSTLSCLIALKTYKMSDSTISKGLEYVKASLPLHFNKIKDDSALVIYALLQEAERLHLELDYEEHYIHYLYFHGQQHVQRLSPQLLEDYFTSYVHVLEAFQQHIPDWNRILGTSQCNDGLFFSPTLTACACMHTGNLECEKYLERVLKKSQNPVPSCTRQLIANMQHVEWLERLGIQRYFEKQIQQTLIHAFRYWKWNEAGCGKHTNRISLEEAALLYRNLRRRGYQVSSDENMFMSNGIQTIGDEFKTIQRINHIKNINEFKSMNLGSSSEMNILALAESYFNDCQAVYQKDIQKVIRWNEDCNFHKLSFARQKDMLSYFFAAATMIESELSIARIVWAQTTVLCTIVDDYLDVHGSLEDLRKFSTVIKTWDLAAANDLPEDARILFEGLDKTVNWIAKQALPIQKRDITPHLRAQWDRLVQADLLEAEWRLLKHCPSLEEYTENAITSFAFEPIAFSAIYFLGAKLDENVFNHIDMINMFRRSSLIGRLLNDIQGFKREAPMGEFTFITIYMKENPGATVDECLAKMQSIIEETTKDLVEDILCPRAMPKACKRVFENVLRITNVIYKDGDWFTSDDLAGHVKGLFNTKME